VSQFELTPIDFNAEGVGQFQPRVRREARTLGMSKNVMKPCKGSPLKYKPFQGCSFINYRDPRVVAGALTLMG
jgi:hypothetical protein